MTALADAHDAAVSQCVALARTIAERAWHSRPHPGRWSLAEELEHVVRTHEMAIETLEGRAELRPMVTERRAHLLRLVVLPIILRTGWFPRVAAPRETRPQVASAVSDPRQLIGRLERASQHVSRLLHTPDALAQAAVVRHPYFGPLRGTEVVRLLIAHLRHHTRRMDARARRHGIG